MTSRDQLEGILVQLCHQILYTQPVLLMIEASVAPQGAASQGLRAQLMVIMYREQRSAGQEMTAVCSSASLGPAGSQSSADIFCIS